MDVQVHEIEIGHISETWVILCCTQSGVAGPPCPSPRLPQGDLCPLFSSRTRHGREGCSPADPRLYGAPALRRACPTQVCARGTQVPGMTLEAPCNQRLPSTWVQTAIMPMNSDSEANAAASWITALNITLLPLFSGT